VENCATARFDGDKQHRQITGERGGIYAPTRQTKRRLIWRRKRRDVTAWVFLVTGKLVPTTLISGECKAEIYI